MIGKVSIMVIGTTLATLLLAGTSAPTSSRSTMAGEGWLSWTPEQRNIYVDAYLSGYISGKTNACIAAAELFEGGRQVSLDDAADRNCFRHAKAYSKGRDDYAALITGFYTKCPKYENAPYAYLMLQLTDDRYKTAEGLCEMAEKGELRTNF
jgi:hypothetical protein